MAARRRLTTRKKACGAALAAAALALAYDQSHPRPAGAAPPPPASTQNGEAPMDGAEDVVGGPLIGDSTPAPALDLARYTDPPSGSAKGDALEAVPGSWRWNALPEIR